MNFKQEILKAIQIMIDKKMGDSKSDRTFPSIIKEINRKGYVILDETGNERTVQCCIPGLELKVGQRVWIKMPCNNLKGMHIVGVVRNK